ncbi:MAG TPA: hypothetical protein VGZ51_04440 [Actinomycetota bacterium]|nr:hypothetical protein [Actinomycetota bacterium]
MAMVESRWFRRAGPAVAALGGVALIATTTLGAPDRAWAPEPCAGVPRIGAPAPGSWYRIDPVLDAGTRTGQRLVLGRAGDRGTRALDLDAESFAAGPYGGATLVGTDDGRRSRLSLVDVARGCAWPLVASVDVVRTATLAPDGASLFEFRVDRKTRADLGVWRRALDGSTAPSRVLAPIMADARFGPTWTTDFVWSEDARSLAVQSCGEISCRVRILDAGRGGVRLVADPALADLVGLDGDRLVAHGACRGLPCPLISMDTATGSALVLDPGAGQAVLSRDAEGRTVVVHEVGTGGDHLRVVGLDGHGPQLIDGDPDGRRLVARPARSGSGAEHARGWLLFGPDGRLPIDGSLRPLLRHVPDGRAVQLDEVSR